MALYILLYIKRDDICIYIYICYHLPDTTASTSTLTGDTRKIFVSNIRSTARVLIGSKPITSTRRSAKTVKDIKLKLF